MSRPTPTRQTLARAAAVVSLVAIGYLALLVVAHPHWAMDLLRLDPQARLATVMASALVTGACAIVLIWLIAARQLRRMRSFLRLHAAQRGTVATEFALALPALFLLFSIIFQLMIIAHASLTVRYASFAAARSATVHMERKLDFGGGLANFANSFTDQIKADGQQAAEQTAERVLASIAHRPPGSRNAIAIDRLMHEQQLWVNNKDYTMRRLFSEAATTAEFDVDFLKTRLEYTMPDSFSPFGEIFAGLVEAVFDKVLKMIEKEFNKQLSNALGVPLPKTNPISGSLLRAFRSLAFDPFLDVVRDIGDMIQIPNPFAGWSPGVDIDNYIAPKSVEVTVHYRLPLTLPGLSLVPGLTEYDPTLKANVITLTHASRIQSTGSRTGLPLISPGGFDYVPLPGRTP